MNRLTRRYTWLSALALVAVAGLPVFAQQGQPARAKQPYRKLAPGVLQSVEPARQVDESFSRHDVIELLAAERADLKFDWARKVAFRHDVWTLEFKFKPVRMVQVDIPQSDGSMKRKLIWYMVYSVTNKPIKEKVVDAKLLEDENAESLPQFGWMHPVRSDDGTYEIQFLNKPIRFVPQFLLDGRESLKEGSGFSKVYMDRVIPVAAQQIRAREDPRRQFYNSAEISQGRISVGKTAWGVATWEDVDSRIDRFSVYVKGLTNAYKWTDYPDRYKKGAPLGSYRSFLVKTLKLNFWRPGDEIREHDGEIRYGVPGGVDYEWTYLVEKGILR